MRVPLAGVLGPIGVELVHATATGIDTDGRVVVVADAGGGTRFLSYDRLLLAAGSQLHRPDVPGLAEHGWSADTLDDTAGDDHQAPTWRRSPRRAHGS